MAEIICPHCEKKLSKPQVELDKKEDEIIIAQKETEKNLAKLQAELDKKTLEHQLALKEIFDEKTKEIIDLQNILSNQSDKFIFFFVVFIIYILYSVS